MRAPRYSASACPLPVPGSRTNSMAPRPMTGPPPPSRPSVASTRTGIPFSFPASAWSARSEVSAGARTVTLQEILDQQSAIRAELAQLEDNASSTEEDAGDYADSLMAKYDELEGRRKPIAERMQKLKLIQLAADDPANTEPGSDDGVRDTRTPDLVVRNKRDPFEPSVLQEIRRAGEKMPGGMIATTELRERAFDAVEFW